MFSWVIQHSREKKVDMIHYYIDKSVLVENRPLAKFIRNYIQDLSGIFSTSSLVRK